MQQYKQDFIEFLVRGGVLKFGEFTYKSGRIGPYFLNFGDINSGAGMAELGKYYAQALQDKVSDFNVLFGPAYKGIPISVATSIALANDFGKDIGYSYNRKEAKDHGEGGNIVGTKIGADSKVVILDDVMTAGTALRESLDILKAAGIPSNQRNNFDEDTMRAIQHLLDRYGYEKEVLPISKIIEIDDQVPGCPINEENFLKVLNKHLKEAGIKQ